MDDVATVLQRLVERLTFAADPHAVVLFGSHAKGTATARSDVDVLVVWDTPLPPLERHPRIAPLAADVARRVDVVICTPGELADAVARPHSFLGSALATGRVLHRRSGYQLPVPAGAGRDDVGGDGGSPATSKIAGHRPARRSMLLPENCDLRCFIWVAIVWKTVYRFVDIASVLSGKVGPHFGGSGLHLVFGGGA